MRRLLIVGCGDIGSRLLPRLRARYRLYVLTRSGERRTALRASGATPIVGDLDRPDSLKRLAGLANDVLHLAPPPGSGDADARTANLVRSLGKGGSLPQRFVYLSTSGVYGDCGGELVREHAPLRPQSDRARRRMDAECRLRGWGRRSGVRVSILRVPGIYAPGRLPLARLHAGVAALRPEEDVYTNHVHADDLAAIVLDALARGRGQRVYNASDASAMKMGEYFDLVARVFGLPASPRVSMEEAARSLSPALLSFMRESRRLDNRRMLRELRARLRYPSVREGVTAARLAAGP
ncbi:MAG: SDR family oxidoreductase [Burkholderiales bacterium]|nr:SDR family oxidoreductase [Burkholderiales bacterium]